ncbi:hypothetical protein U3653_02450 [Nocardia sp. CDC186]|uniref:Uncharacterized protein n=1 Tax=Nocardia implantans TaxID=3108168 RepID=A0ABU6AN21_9NOCA|nr:MULTISPECIES: hypothetical protein [unclassified Nocardia]MBF6192036.1 hypothetical protein [Nocardia beijingensis]MEA3530166.1 hypothetical protein [Nocardia sp. CDC192]MEB3508874.1 hypothetical protein [Nocardia sp. CDC186]
MQNIEDEAAAFAALVMQHLSTLDETEAEYDPDQFAIRTGDLFLDLHNIFRETRELDAAEREARVAQHCAAVRELRAPAPDWPAARSMLRPLLRPNSFGVGVEPESRPIARSAFPFVDEMVAIDMPQTRSIVTYASLREWGVSSDEVFTAARENLAAIVAFTDFEEDGVLQFVDDGDGYCTSWPLLPGWLAGSGFGNRAPIAFMPDVDTLIVATGADDLEPIFEVVEEQYHDAARPISPQGYTVDDSGAIIPLDRSPAHRHLPAVQRARCGLAVTEYDAQARILNEIVERDLEFTPYDLEPAYVGSVMYGHGDNGPFTITVWGEGVEYLLPEADYVAFCRDDQGELERLFEVPFDAVVGLTGLTPVPDLSPRRYEIRHWPDAETLAALEAAAVSP